MVGKTISTMLCEKHYSLFQAFLYCCGFGPVFVTRIGGSNLDDPSLPPWWFRDQDVNVTDTTNACRATSCWWTCGQNWRRVLRCQVNWLLACENYDCLWASWTRSDAVFFWKSTSVAVVSHSDHLWITDIYFPEIMCDRFAVKASWLSPVTTYSVHWWWGFCLSGSMLLSVVQHAVCRTCLILLVLCCCTNFYLS